MRAYPRRLSLNNGSWSGSYFVPELAPVALHPAVSSLGKSLAEEILVQSLYTYLEATTIIEAEVVNTVAKEIVQGTLGVKLPEEMVFDACKIYCDEAYHALFSYDLKREVELVTRIPPNPVNNAPVIERLSQIQSTIAPEYRGVSRVMVAIIFETMITAILSKIPKDNRVVSVVREVLADHAEDEGRHHVYFTSLFEAYWPELSALQRRAVGPLLPQFILEYVRPNTETARYSLAKYGFSPDEIETIITDSHPAEQFKAQTREIAKATMTIFDSNGVFDDRETYEAFQECELIP